ncbi:MAG: LysM peptidoglycan-binding domain-containing protein [Longimicrobiales bacterium]
MNGRNRNPTRTLFSLVILIGAALPASAQEPATQSREHLVRAGDTLWDLANFYFTNPFLWPTIFEANRDVVEDPHWIYPGERLMIPGVEGGLPVAVQPDTVAEGVFEATGQTAQGRTRFYTPPAAANEERAFALVSRSEPLYAVSPGEYNSAAWLADSATSSIRGRLIGMADPVTHGDKFPPVLHPYDRVLVGAMRGDAATAGDSMLVVRFDPPVGLLGNIVVPVALVAVDSVGESVMEARVVRQYGPAKVGDYLIPYEAPVGLMRRQPSVAASGPEGLLVAFLDGEPLFGTYDNGFVDLGREDGLMVGDELIAFVPARPNERENAELPPEVVATLRVVKVRENSATVRVAGASSTALTDGLIVRVVRKMQ